MKVSIECKDRYEADAIRRAMGHPTTRATVLVTGILLGLPTDRARARTINYTWDKVQEDAEMAEDAPAPTTKE